MILQFFIIYYNFNTLKVKKRIKSYNIRQKVILDKLIVYTFIYSWKKNIRNIEYNNRK